MDLTAPQKRLISETESDSEKTDIININLCPKCGTPMKGKKCSTCEKETEKKRLPRRGDTQRLPRPK